MSVQTQRVILRDYQEDYVRDVEQARAEGLTKVLCVAPGGSGKTTIGGQLIHNELLNGGRALILTNRQKLATQFQETVLKFGIPCCLEMSGKRWQGSKVLSATVQTMAGEIKKGRFKPDQFSLIIIDEADESYSEKYMACMEHFKGAFFVGFTATAYRSDQKDLMKIYDRKIENVTMIELMERGYLSQLMIENIPVKIQVDKAGRGDFTDSEVSHAIEPYLEALADEVMKRSKDKCCLMFLPLVETSKRFSQMLNDRGLVSEHVDGTMDDVEGAISRLESRQIDCLCCSMLLTRGVDIPPVSLIGMFRITNSWALYVQSIVRGTRLHSQSTEKPWPDKDHCTILDPMWQCNQHNAFQTPAAAITPDVGEQEYITREMQENPGKSLLELRTGAANAREDNLRRKLEETKKRKARLINAIEFFKSSKVDYAVKNIRWNKESPTPGQINILEKNGFDIEEITSRDQASQIIDEIISRVKIGLCSPAQAIQLKNSGYKGEVFSLTFNQASELINTL